MIATSNQPVGQGDGDSGQQGGADRVASTAAHGVDALVFARWSKSLGDAAGVVLTPTHQFPTGMPLAPKRRTEVLACARRTGAVILEDGYGGEFRHHRQTIGAFQGPASDVVAWPGSASRGRIRG